MIIKMMSERKLSKEPEIRRPRNEVKIGDQVFAEDQNTMTHIKDRGKRDEKRRAGIYIEISHVFTFDSI